MRRYFSVHIAIFYKVAIHSCKFFFCKWRHGIFCTVLNGDVANNHVMGL